MSLSTTQTEFATNGKLSVEDDWQSKAPVIDSTINYYLERPPGQVAVTSPGTVGFTRAKYDVRPVKITDIRSISRPKFQLDVHGFSLEKFDGVYGNQYETFADEEIIRTKYYEEVRQLVLKMTGATDVLTMSHRVRKITWQDAKKRAEDPNEPDSTHIPEDLPAMYAHTDQTYRGAYTILNLQRQLHGARGEQIYNMCKTSRWAIINVWKPLKTITREPLAVCDATTVQPADLAHNTMLWEDSGLEIRNFYLKYNQQHRWYWVRDMRPDEALVFKQFDSRVHDGTARVTPHTAIQTPEDCGPPRESIELRHIVVWEGEEKY